MSYAELWSSMGLFAKGIVVVMFVMSAWSWAVSISKWIYLRKSQKETRKFAPEFSRYLQEEQPPIVDVPQLKGFQTVVAPTDIPTNIPPINLQEHFDPKDYTGTGVEGGIGTGIVPSSDQVFMESVVEERPEVLSGPQLQYPDLLRQAGVQGRVLVQAIIDTSGRAEPPSVKIIQSPNPGFDQPAKNYVLRALFRPARVHGRAVRVLVNLPIDFKIKR